MAQQVIDVLVVGAGPTGLSAANEAVRHGLSVRVVDRKGHRSTYSKALVAHARTLEAFEAMGLVGAVTDAGVPFSAMRVLPGDGMAPVRVDLMHLDWGDTRYPYWLSIPQFETERCLEEHLEQRGVSVDWSTPFVSFVEHPDYVDAVVEHSDGSQESIRAKWLIGCDGGRSLVREQAGLGFDSASIGQTFLIADALGDTPMPEDEGTTSLSSKGVLFLVPMPEPKRWRIIAHLPDAVEGERVDIDSELVDQLLSERLGFDFGAHDLSWTSQFVLKQGVARGYRKGRVFIAGDAAHLHSPVGGQGLNTGVQDAYALIWRIALAERAVPGHEALLDSYESERRAVAQSMVRNTTRATSLVTLHGGVLAKLRGFVATQALKTQVVQNQLGRNVGMLELDCAGSPIVGQGPSGSVGPGGRLPNPELRSERLHDLLHGRRHTVLLLGGRGAAMAGDLRSVGVAVVEVDDDGLREALGGAVLAIVRPDRIIAVTSEVADPGVVYAYARGMLGISPREL